MDKATETFLAQVAVEKKQPCEQKPETGAFSSPTKASDLRMQIVAQWYRYLKKIIESYGYTVSQK